MNIIHDTVRKLLRGISMRRFQAAAALRIVTQARASGPCYKYLK
jgi:hypothetical protein